MSDETGEKQKPAHLFQPGKSGNPKGRPKGARSRLGEDFVKALADDFEVHGAEVIAKVRDEKPADYVRVVASLLPKQVEIKEGTFDGLSDEDLADVLATVLALTGAEGGAGAGGEAEDGAQPSPRLPTLQ